MVKNSWRLFLMILCACMTCGVPALSHAAYGSRDYVDLHPPGWLSSKALCVNGRGDVAGYGVTSQGERGFLWSAGRYTILIPPGASSSRATWVNNRGDVAGTAYDAEGNPHAFLFRNGEYVDPTPGWAYSEALYVGEDGVVTGSGEGGGFVAGDDGISVSPAFTTIVGRNSNGELLGHADNVARLYIPGKGYLDLVLPGGDSASPGRVNEKGLVTFSSPVKGVEKGCVYSGGFIILMTPPGWTSSRATAINNLSEVAGYGDGPQGRRGFLRAGADYEEIGYPGWASTAAESVNDLGQVAGSGENGSGETRAFLSSPESLAVVANDPGNGGGISAGGGCSVTPGRGEPVSTAGVFNILLLLSPIGVPVARALSRRSSR